VHNQVKGASGANHESWHGFGLGPEQPLGLDISGA
jgi:hypothetical protein